MTSHKAKFLKQKIDFGKNGFGSQKVRNLPFFSKIQILFSGVKTAIGLVFLLLGLAFLYGFGLLVNFDDWKFSESDPITTNVKILSVNETSAKENDVTVLRYNYSYKTLSGEEYTDFSYHTGNANFEKNKVRVQYLKDKPFVSRIVGMRKGTFSAWVLVIISIFPFIGLVLVFFGFRENLKYIELVKYGKLALGTYSHEEITGESVNNKKVIKFFFTFADETGKEYLASGKTHRYQRLTDEDKERLVYKPEKPEENVMIDALPVSVKRFFDKLES